MEEHTTIRGELEERLRGLEAQMAGLMKEYQRKERMADEIRELLKPAAVRTIPTDEVEGDIVGAANATCDQMREFYGADPKFVHLPEQCSGCRPLRDRIRQSFELGYYWARDNPAPEST